MSVHIFSSSISDFELGTSGSSNLDKTNAEKDDRKWNVLCVLFSIFFIEAVCVHTRAQWDFHTSCLDTVKFELYFYLC